MRDVLREMMVCENRYVVLEIMSICSVSIYLMKHVKLYLYVVNVFKVSNKTTVCFSETLSPRFWRLLTHEHVLQLCTVQWGFSFFKLLSLYNMFIYSCIYIN